MMHVQHDHNQRYDALIAQQAEFNRDVKESLAGINLTLARVETLLARLIPPGEHGREA